MPKKKILLLSDDLRMHSGVATMSRELVLGAVHKYDFVQLAGAIKNPDSGKVMDLSQATKDLIKQGKIKSDNDDVYVKLYPVDGYGNEEILYAVINQEKPDAILHFTDPRFWGWLYQMEHTLRKKMPLTYLNIWDDLPYPMYNRAFYESCDALFSISKQTMNINRWVLGDNNCCTIHDAMAGKSLLHYVPHGINEDIFHKKDRNTQDYKDRYNLIFRGKKYNFVIFYNSRNVQRKRTSNIVLGYRAFCDNLPPEEAKKCCLLLHTEVMHEAGTNLLALKEALCPDYDIVFSPAKLPPEEMPFLYSIADVTVNASCIPPGYKVATESGPKNIEDIKVGEMVLTHKGRFKPVSKTFQYDNTDCEMVKITPFNLHDPVELTSEHPVWAIQRRDMKSRLMNETTEVEKYMKWIKAGDLAPGDLVMYPEFSGVETSSTIDLKDYCVEHKHKKYMFDEHRVYLRHNDIKLSRFIQLDEDLSYLLGRWCGDGSNNTICFDEKYGTSEIERLGKIFESTFKGTYRIDHHNDTNKNCIILSFKHPYMSLIQNLLKTLCGNNSFNKHIPNKILYGNKNNLTAFINGLIDSDGCERDCNGSNHTKIVTVSELLKHQLIFALVRLNKKVRLSEGTSGYKPGNTHHQIMFTHSKDDNGSSRSWFRNGYYLMSVNKIEKYLYSGKVHNLEVESDNSYVSSCIATHNSNEGFGLSAAESLMCETPIIVSVTGGLQDQIGQTDDTGKPVEFNQDFGSNSCGKYKNHGVWAYPLWPATRMIQGSIPTPYIFDDIVKWEDIAESYMYWYKMPEAMRKKCGAEGRRWVCNEGGLNATNMCKQFVDGMEYVFRNWKPRRSFGIYTEKDHVGNFMIDNKPGFEIPHIDQAGIEEKIKKTEAKLNKL